MSPNEFDLIDRFFKGLTATDASVICGIGDDAAVIELTAGHELLVSTDTLISGIHFFPGADPFDVGYKSLAVNLSDIAAMGAVPRWATLALTLPEGDASWLNGFAKGFSALANSFSISLIGGDLTHGPLSITVQILGEAPKGTAIKRSGANPGDLIYVSGCLGAAGYALKILNGEMPGSGAAPEVCLRRLLRPEPRVTLGAALRGHATAAIDISDGLAADLGHILNASGVGAVVEMAKLPLCAGADQISDPALLWQTVLSAGDDYELCFTLPQGQGVEGDVPVTCIGEITREKKLRWLTAAGSEYEGALSGYQHFL